MFGGLKKLKGALGKTRERLSSALRKLVGGGLDNELAEQVEEELIAADVGVFVAEDLIEDLRERIGRSDDPMELLKKEIIEHLGEMETLSLDGKKPRVWVFVGINGTGKTTTIGKLAHRLKQDGRKVLLTSADTFRAAADEQLAIWAERANVDIVRSQRGADSASVAYDAISKGINGDYDVVMIDTAGRLHTKTNLMEELSKVIRVVGKRLEGAPHEVLLTVDATTGQNGLAQAEVFHKATQLTGLVLTKLDSTAKGGIALSIRRKLGIPIKLVGVGEGMDDITDFDPETFVRGLIE